MTKTFSITIVGEKEAAKMFGALTKTAKTEIEKALVRCGIKVEGDAKRIVPVKTGRLRASIKADRIVKNWSTKVGTNVNYAPYVERAQPYMRPALYNNQKFCVDYMRNAINNAIRTEIGKIASITRGITLGRLR